MKKFFKTIIILTIIIIILLLSAIIYFINLEETVTEKTNETDEELEFMEMYRFYENKELGFVESYENFYNATECVEKYTNCITQEKMNLAYNLLLDSEYKKNTTFEEFCGIYSKYIGKENYGYRCNYMKNQTKNGIHIYLIYGEFIEYPISENSTREEMNYILKQDFKNSSFSIEPMLNNKIENLKFPKEITKNEYNKLNINIVTDIDKFKDYYFYFIEESTLDAEKAFYMLDEQYRTERFKDIESFKTYIKEVFNPKEIFVGGYHIELENYSSIKQELTIQSIADITKVKSIIINEQNSNDFKIILDRYTIPTEIVKQQYASYTEEEKAIFNARNIVDSLQTEYYEYSYNHISDAYKVGNIATLELYKQQLEDLNLNKYYIKSESQIRKDQKTYIYAISVIEPETLTEKTIEVSIILKEEMDFLATIKII